MTTAVLSEERFRDLDPNLAVPEERIPFLLDHVLLPVEATQGYYPPARRHYGERAEFFERLGPHGREAIHDSVAPAAQ